MDVSRDTGSAILKYSFHPCLLRRTFPGGTISEETPGTPYSIVYFAAGLHEIGAFTPIPTLPVILRYIEKKENNSRQKSSEIHPNEEKN